MFVIASISHRTDKLREVGVICLFMSFEYFHYITHWLTQKCQIIFLQRIKHAIANFCNYNFLCVAQVLSYVVALNKLNPRDVMRSVLLVIVHSKLRRLGFPNRIVDDSDSKLSEFDR